MPWQNSESSPVFRSLLLLGVVAGFFSCLPQGFADTSRKSPATAPVSSSRNSGIPENIPEAGKDAAINGARTQEVDSSFSRPSFSCDVALGATLTTSTISASQAAAMQTYSMTQSIGLGFVGGVFLGYEATPEWEFEVGLQFSRRRIDYSLNAVLVGSEHVEFSYLELPAILRYRFSPNFSAGGGVYYAQGLGGVSIV